MVNLKKFCRNLQNEMVSHITLYLPSIAKPSLCLFDLILSKTNFSNHITQFIRMLNSRLFSFLEASKASKFNSLIGHLPVSTGYHATGPI